MKIAKLQQQLSHLPQDGLMKIHYYTYARKSSESEDAQMASIGSQLDTFKPLYESRSNLTTFSESKSAKAPGRTEFNKMVDAINKREDIKGIICWDLSRLFRNPIDEGSIRWLLDSGKIEEVVTPFKVYKKDDSSLMMAVEGGKAQSFIQDLRRNTKRGMDKKLENGIAPLLAPPGYYNDTTLRQGERDIKPHPIYFDMVKYILKLALTGKYSTVALLHKAEQMGIKNSRGQAISKTQMYVMLRSPFYAGWFVYAGKLYKGTHKQMISKREFDAIQEVLDGKSIQHKITDHFPLRGLITCGYCNYGIVGERHTKASGKIFDYYTCTSKKKRGGCEQTFHIAEDLEQQVHNFLGTIKISEKFINWASKWLKETELQDRSVRENTFTALRTEHAQIELQLNTLTDKWLAAKLEDSEYQGHKTRYMQRLQVLDEQLSQADEDWSKWTDYTIKIMDFARTAQDRWQVGSIEDKKTILTVIGSNLVLTKEKLVVTPKSPFMAIKKNLEATISENQGSNAQSMPKFLNSSVWGPLPNEVRTSLINSTTVDFSIYDQHIFNYA